MLHGGSVIEERRTHRREGERGGVTIMARICQRCSHHNEDHAKFCLSCGAMLDAESPSLERTRATRAIGIVDDHASEPLSVGRSSSNDIVIDHDTVSSHHGNLHQRHGMVLFEDCGSTNSSIIRGSVLLPGQRISVSPGEYFQLGQAAVYMGVDPVGRPTLTLDASADAHAIRVNESPVEPALASKTSAMPLDEDPNEHQDKRAKNAIVLAATPSPADLDDDFLGGTVLGPAIKLFQAIEGIDGHREFLDLLSPTRFLDALEAGRRLGNARFRPVMGRHAVAAFDTWFARARHQLQALQPTWNEADQRQRGMIVESLKAGLTSEEAQLGAAVGSLFGPLGMMIGGSLGGFVAGSKVEEAIQQSVTRYATVLDSWWDGITTDYDTTVVPGFERDEAEARSHQPVVVGQKGPARTSPLAAIVTAVVVTAGLAFGGWLFFVRDDPAADATAPTSDPAGEAPTAPESALPEGAWRSDGGRVFDLTTAGDEIELHAVAESDLAQGQGYLPGEVVFVLTPGEANHWTVRHKLRPHLPDGAQLDGAEAVENCQRLVTAIDGEPLVARYDGTSISLEFASFETSRRNFRRRGGRVQSCMGLSELSLARREMTLRPSESVEGAAAPAP